MKKWIELSKKQHQYPENNEIVEIKTKTGIICRAKFEKMDKEELNRFWLVNDEIDQDHDDSKMILEDVILAWRPL